MTNYKDLDIVSLHKETINIHLTQEEKNKAYDELKNRERKKPFTKSELQQMNSNIIQYKKENLHLKKSPTKTKPILEQLKSKENRIKKIFKKLFRI